MKRNFFYWRGTSMTVEIKQACLPEIVEFEILCSICRSTYTTDTVASTPCGHKFHATCLLAWEMKKLNCPICRHEYDKSVFNCVTLCLKCGPIPEVKGVHRCPDESSCGNRLCTGPCANRQIQETSVILNSSIQNIIDKVASIYSRMHKISALERFAHNGFCRACTQNIFCYWNPISGPMTKCPKCGAGACMR